MSSVPEFLHKFACWGYPQPLKNASNFHPDSHEIFAKKLPLDGGFTLENRNKNSDKSRRI
jgi:hypothetical protein